MRNLALILSLLAMWGLFACSAEETDFTRELSEREAAIKDQEEQIHSLETQLDQIRKDNRQLSDENRALNDVKELGVVELSNLEWEEDDDRLRMILRGTVKNTGRSFVWHVTIKVAINDETENVIEADLSYDPDDRGKIPMLFYHNAADSLNIGDSKDFEIIIYTRNIFAGSLGKVKEAIRNHESQVEYVALFRSR